VSRSEWEAKRALAKKAREEERAAYVKKSWIIRTLVNLALIRLVSSYYSAPLPFAEQWPLSMFSNEEGRISCSILMIAGNIILQF
jgi:hypothetical protein